MTGRIVERRLLVATAHPPRSGEEVLAGQLASPVRSRLELTEVEDVSVVVDSVVSGRMSLMWYFPLHEERPNRTADVNSMGLKLATGKWACSRTRRSP